MRSVFHGSTTTEKITTTNEVTTSSSIGKVTTEAFQTSSEPVTEAAVETDATTSNHNDVPADKTSYDITDQYFVSPWGMPPFFSYYYYPSGGDEDEITGEDNVESSTLIFPDIDISG